MVQRAAAQIPAPTEPVKSAHSHVPAGALLVTREPVVDASTHRCHSCLSSTSRRICQCWRQASHRRTLLVVAFCDGSESAACNEPCLNKRKHYIFMEPVLHALRDKKRCRDPKLRNGAVVKHKRLRQVLQLHRQSRRSATTVARRARRRAPTGASRVRKPERLPGTKKQREFTQADVEHVIADLAGRARSAQQSRKPGRRSARAG